MIVVTITLVPSRGGPAKLLGKAVIANDGSGSRSRGNYYARLFLKRKSLWRSGYHSNFPRQRKNVWFLVSELLNDALGNEK